MTETGVIEKLQRAHQFVCDLLENRAVMTMTIPPSPTDWDVIVLGALDAALEEIRALRYRD